MAKQAGVFRAVGLGFKSIAGNGRLFGLGLALEAGLGICRFGLGLATFGMLARGFARGAAQSGSYQVGEVLADGLDAMLSARVVLPALGLWLSVELLGAALRTLYLGAAVDRLSATAKGEPHSDEPVLVSAARTLGRAVAARVWLMLADFALSAWSWLLLGASAVAIGHALHSGAHTLRAAAGAGVAAGLLGVVALVFSLYGRVYLVRAVRGPEGSLASAWDAAGLLGNRFTTYLGIAVFQIVLAFGVSSIAGSVGATAALAGSTSPAVSMVMRLASSLAAAVLGAAAELVILGSVCAIDLDAHGELPPPPEPPAPPPPPPQPVLVAQEILVAKVIEPPPEGSGA